MRFVGALSLAAALLGGAHPALAAERFAIVLGNNQGGPGRVKLWFAERDAEHFAETLTELGAFAPSNVLLLKGADLSGFQAAFNQVEARIERDVGAGERAMLVIYFSGHAAPDGLELGDDLLRFADLRSLVSHSKADVKVAIVDACDSGTLTQVKGGRPARATFPLPGEQLVEGVAFVASTALGESAQESTALEGSVFTHFLDVALRGAGDADGDGQVSLDEAFRYASGRTVAGTASTEAGPQHPTYSVHMSGRGEVVLSDLRQARASLTLPADAHALYVLHGPGDLVAEVPGAASPVTLALPVGEYQVERRAGAHLDVGTVTLDPGTSLALPPLQAAAYEASRTKGGRRPVEIFAGGAVGNGILSGIGLAPVGRIGAGYGYGPVNLRLRLDYSQKSVDGAELSYGFRTLGGALEAALPVVRRAVAVEVGTALGYAWDTQTLRDGSHDAVGEGNAGLLLDAFWSTGPFALRASAEGTLHRFALDGRPVVRPTAAVGLVAGYAL